jgi:O-acetyl-ADP-ribose deacetylase (regulator of RNase III)
MTMRVGVANAQRRAGGDDIQTEAMDQAPAAMGDVVWTNAGGLDARWVAHAVSALAGAVCLQRCTLRVLFEAEARGARRVVFPAIGTGVGEVPMAQGAKLVLEAIRTFAGLGETALDTIAIALFDDDSLDQWTTVLRGM